MPVQNQCWKMRTGQIALHAARMQILAQIRSIQYKYYRLQLLSILKEVIKSHRLQDGFWICFGRQIWHQGRARGHHARRVTHDAHRVRQIQGLSLTNSQELTLLTWLVIGILLAQAIRLISGISIKEPSSPGSRCWVGSICIAFSQKGVETDLRGSCSTK